MKNNYNLQSLSKFPSSDLTILSDHSIPPTKPPAKTPRVSPKRLRKGQIGGKTNDENYCKSREAQII